LFFEEWADQAALDFHFKSPHFQEFIKEFTPLLQAPPDIRIYEVAEARTLEL
jgi:quinol monooxygenase YgiN